MLDIRSYKTTDYPVYNGWVEKYGWGSIPEDALSPTGLVVVDPISNKPMAIGFVYFQVGCNLCFMDFIVADPDLQPTKRFRASSMLIEGLQELAIKQTGGKGWLYSMSPNKSYVKIAQSKGFKIAEQQVTTLFYPLDGNEERVGFLCSEIKE